MQETNLGL